MDKEKKAILFAAFPPMGEFDEKAKARNDNHIIRGSVRMNRGMYRTDKELEKYIEDSLKRKLP